MFPAGKMKLKRVFIQIIAVFLIGPLCVFAQDKNGFVANEKIIFLADGFKVEVSPGIKAEQPPYGGDFELYHFYYEDEFLLGAYSGNFPGFGHKYSESLVKSVEQWTHVSAKCNTDIGDGKTVVKECLVDWGEMNSFPRYVHFFFKSNNKELNARAEKIMSSVQHNPVAEDTVEKQVEESGGDSKESPKMRRYWESRLAKLNRSYDFYDAVKDLNYSKMKKLIQEGFNLNSSEGLEEPVLNSTIEFSVRFPEKGDYFPVVKFLVEHGAQVDPPIGKYGRKPLGVAAYTGNLSMVKYLIQKGAEIEGQDSFGRTPIVLAVRGHPNTQENYSVVDYLVKKKANIEARDGFGRPPLFLAVFKGYFKTAELLIQSGANIHAVDKDDRNLLKILSRPSRWLTENDYDILKLLLKNGLDPNVDSEIKRSFLENLSPYLEVHSMFDKYWKENRQFQSLDNEAPLISFSCGVGGSSMTPLKTAVKNKDYKGVKKLLKEGADVNELDGQRTPLNIAIFGEDQKMVDLLLLLGADINRVDKKCPNSPLHDATYRGYYSLVEHLIKKGARPNIRNYLGEGPLHVASKMGHYQTTRILLEADLAWVNVKKPDGDTALHMVLSKFTENPQKRIPLIKLLLENGASPHLKNKAGKSPWSLIQVYPKINNLVLSHSKNP
jgi:ankyrin repeat protein